MNAHAPFDNVIDLGRQTTGLAPLPISIEAEQAVLGAALMHNELLGPLSRVLQIDHFSEEVHQRIFDIALNLFGLGKPATPITLRTYLGDAELGQGVTVSGYLARLAAASIGPLAAIGMAREIADMAGRRKIIQHGEEMARLARDARPSASCVDLAAGCLLDLQAIIAETKTDTARPVGDFADELLETVEGVLAGTIEQRTITTGYKDVDEATSGFEPGTLWVTAGRPGMGKTIFANSTGYRCARSGVGVLEFPLEVGVTQMVARHLADMAYRGAGRSVAFRDIGRRAREMSEDQVRGLREAHARLRALPIIIDSRSRVTLPQIAAKVAQAKRELGNRGVDLGLVIIDHLDFIACSDRYSGNRVQEIGEIAIGLKGLARSESVCINLLSQLSRNVEQRPIKDRRPTLADLRNSGDLEQAADVVAFLYREEYYLTRSPEYLRGDDDATNAAIAAKGKLEMILSKVRSGPTPTVHLFCDAAASSISSFDRGR